MNEMKPEDVMRALECCEQHGKCKECPLKDKGIHGCMFYLMHRVIILLREKDAARKELWEERMRIYNDLQEWKEECKKYQDACREKDAEIEKLKKGQENVSAVCKSAMEHYDSLYEQAKDILKAAARDEAITEFSLRLKSCEFYEVADECDGMQYIDFCDWVDQIAKEMKGN